MNNYRGVPERFRKEGIFAHYGELVHAGDTVEACKNVAGIIPKGARLLIKELLIEPNGNQRGFRKRLRFDGWDGDFNPQRFKLVTPPGVEPGSTP